MNGPLKLDRLDLRILSQLQKNGRITNVDLADAVGLSPSPCLIRVKRLEQAGYISGYGAQLRLEKLGDTLTVFTEVTLSDHHREDFVRFEAAIRGVDEILECLGGRLACRERERSGFTSEEALYELVQLSDDVTSGSAAEAVLVADCPSPRQPQGRPARQLV